MKILIVSQYYAPEEVPIPQSLARQLALNGHEVRVLTGFPNYPSGKVFPGYRQRLRSKSSDGSIEVLRVPLWANHSNHAVQRFLNYASFALSSASASRFAKGTDAIYVYATQMSAAFGPWLWRILGGAPYILHVQDLWPDSVLGSSMLRNARVAKAVGVLLNSWIASVYRRAHSVIGIAPTMVDTLKERGVPSQKTHLVYNWAVDAPATPERSSGDSLTKSTTDVVYAGNVGDMQNLDAAIDAVHACQDAGVCLTVIGEGVALPRLISRARSLGADNIRFIGRQPREEMANYYAAADYALIPLKDLPVFRGTIPSKLQACLAHGLPVITTVQGDVKRLVETTRVGLVADPDSTVSLEAALRQAARITPRERKSMAHRARGTYEMTFSLEASTGAIEQLLREASEQETPGRRRHGTVQS